MRTQATLATEIWTSYCSVATSGTISAALPGQDSSSSGQTDACSDDAAPRTRGIKSLTLELSEACMSIRLLQCGLLLCMIGPISATTAASPATVQSNQSSPPSQRASLPNSVRMPAHIEATSPASVVLSRTQASYNSVDEDTLVGTVALISAQADRLAKFLDRELSDFTMPRCFS